MAPSSATCEASPVTGVAFARPDGRLSGARAPAGRAAHRLARLLEGKPTVLARGGQWDTEALRREGLRQADVDAAVRRQGADGIEEIDQLTIEPGGAIVATLLPGDQNASADDIRRLEAKLDELLTR